MKFKGDIYLPFNQKDYADPKDIFQQYRLDTSELILGSLLEITRQTQPLLSKSIEQLMQLQVNGKQQALDLAVVTYFERTELAVGAEGETAIDILLRNGDPAPAGAHNSVLCQVERLINQRVDHPIRMTRKAFDTLLVDDVMSMTEFWDRWFDRKLESGVYPLSVLNSQHDNGTGRTIVLTDKPGEICRDALLIDVATGQWRWCYQMGIGHDGRPLIHGISQYARYGKLEGWIDALLAKLNKPEADWFSKQPKRKTLKSDADILAFHLDKLYEHAVRHFDKAPPSFGDQRIISEASVQFPLNETDATFAGYAYLKARRMDDSGGLYCGFSVTNQSGEGNINGASVNFMSASRQHQVTYMYTDGRPEVRLRLDQLPLESQRILVQVIKSILNAT